MNGPKYVLCVNRRVALSEGDYMGRVAGSIFISEGSDLPWVGTVPEWKSCKRNVVNARQTTASGRRLLAALEVWSSCTPLRSAPLRSARFFFSVPFCICIRCST